MLGQAAGMGYTTDFLGHIDINPALNQAEIAYLQAFGRSRRYDRPGGPYEVPANPYAEAQQGRDSSVPVETYNRVAPGQPQLWCQWTPCWDGCCLTFDGFEKFYRPVQWMEYLIGHFLKPGAKASDSGLPAFADFSFDHVLEGIMVGCRRDNKELFAIRVQDNVVTTEILHAADPQLSDYPPLAYELALDADREWSQRRKRSGRGRRSARTPGIAAVDGV